VPRGYLCDLLEPDIATRFEECLERLRSAGALMADVALRHASLTAAIYLHIVLADAAAYHAATLERAPERYTPPVRLRLEMGRYVLGEDYVRALEGREVLRREVDAALSGFDGLVLPTLPITAPLLGAASVRIGGADEPVRNLMLRQTQLFNLTGHPAIAIPAGAATSGLPWSIQLVGATTGELLPAALACEPYITGEPSPRSGRLGG
jgi:aspartyl-tRNA(Asn)/glutamyl-tRNA(Gln) amidotransferase subunit A